MIVEAVILSLIVGLLRRGKIMKFAELDIRYIYFFMFGAIGQALVFNLADPLGSGFGLFLYNGFYIFHMITYLLILIPLLLNMEWIGFKLMAVGTIMNFIPIFTNGGKMPVKVPNGYQPIFDAGHTLLVDSTNYKMFSDLFFIGPPYPLPKVLSIGDLFLVIGVFWFIQTVMTKQL